jgi:hypothetical protein
MLLLRIAGPRAVVSAVYHTDELPLPVIHDSDDRPIVVQWFSPVYSQPLRENDELHVSLTTIVEDDYQYTQIGSQLAVYALPLRSDDELAQPSILEEEFYFPVLSLAYKAFSQPLTDTDEFAFVPLSIADDDLAWVQVKWQVSYVAQPVLDTDEVSIARIVEDEFYLQGFPRYLGYFALSQPYMDDDSFHFLPPIITGVPQVVNFALSLMRLGGMVGGVG